MTIASMTGFARQSGEVLLGENQFSWVWEAKSVNGKNPEFKSKLPAAEEDLSLQLKAIAAKYLLRGNVSAYLDLKNSCVKSSVKINQELLDELTQKAIILYQQHAESLQKPLSSDLLMVKGVVEIEDSVLSEEESNELKRRLLEDFEVLCRKLAEDRRKEGEKMKRVLDAILSDISCIVARIGEIAAEMPAKLKTKLEEQLKRWTDPAQQLSEDRIAQELVFYVTKADIREEIDRLQAHIKTARDLLDSQEAVGRRLDFLCQELNREANTTCSKSCDIELTNLGMDLKALIEQFREQVQNIE